MKSKGKSAHDLADDPRLSSVVGDIDTPPATAKATEEQLAAIKQKLQQRDDSGKTEKVADSSKESSRSSKLWVLCQSIWI